MKPEILLLQGRNTPSDFRTHALLRRMTELNPEAGEWTVEQIPLYLIRHSGLSGTDGQRLDALLDTPLPLDAAGPLNFITPRKGTISPWSSKATDIVQQCGITSVLRVEHGSIVKITDPSGTDVPPSALGKAAQALFDPMTEGLYTSLDDFFETPEPGPLQHIPLRKHGRSALEEANRTLGLALRPEEIDYLEAAYARLDRDPTDVELVMFGQVNSEHCRHKIFNADWIIDGAKQDRSLFDMIRHTHAVHPQGTRVAYKDNAGICDGSPGEFFEANRSGTFEYEYRPHELDLLIKVETHNHPTAIAPFPGAATGVGGEIRDEAATGTGGRSKAGLSAFMVSNLRIPGAPRPWETDDTPFPDRLATPLEIMLEAPIGGAGFGNEFGRPQLLGLFKTLELRQNGALRGYHKPIMAAGGMGVIKRIHNDKKAIQPRSLILQLGGPAMKIGLGGGAASSMDTGSNAAELDFDSVQRDNAEMERRCQEVIDACISMETDNPILSIHDIGAGGLSNGCPELVADTGGHFQLRGIHCEDPSMSPMEIWCCEAQERYVLAIAPGSKDLFLDLCQRERCPVAVIGEAADDGRLILEDDDHEKERVIDMDMSVLLGKPPRLVKDVTRRPIADTPFQIDGIRIDDAARRILELPTVGDKSFLITIADRSITGLVARDQMVGPYQVPVADYAATATSYQAASGEAMAMGERTNLALISGPASGRMAVGEALTNLIGAGVRDLNQVKLSANWMCACGAEGEDAVLYDTVKAVGLDLCPALGVSIPVGKDSLSMRSTWEEEGHRYAQTAPLSLLISAFAAVDDLSLARTPHLQPVNSYLLLLDFGHSHNRLGGSALAQVYNGIGANIPDLEQPHELKRGLEAVQTLLREGLILALHDKSDGGLFVTLCEMAFTARSGLDVSLDCLGDEILSILFNEELGLVLQIPMDGRDRVSEVFEEAGLSRIVHRIGNPIQSPDLLIRHRQETFYQKPIMDLHKMWSSTSYEMQKLRDNPDCAEEEHRRLDESDDRGLFFNVPFEVPDPLPSISVQTARPRVAILREQGINGHMEMAAAFDRAGFTAVDVHMTDVLEGRCSLADMQGLAACGGFSYGDVLGAGSGWARGILFHAALRDAFEAFFHREDSFTLGVCNGCQMVSQLAELIPGADAWPRFKRNRSEQFEARLSQLEILPSPSVLLTGMEGACLPVPVAHGEGRAEWADEASQTACIESGLAAGRYIDSHGAPAERYPANPNGSPGGLTAFTTPDGRATILMPHPERVFRSLAYSWAPEDIRRKEHSPWMQLFLNARSFTA